MTETIFLKNDNKYHPAPKDRTIDTVHAELPAGVYLLRQTPFGYFFEVADPFEINHKLYGTTEKRSARILSTFMDRPNITGVLMSGEKGSGKTLLARKVAIDAVAAGMPVVLLNEPHAGEEFNTFVQDLKQPMVFLADEFEKTYQDEAQQALLTLLDGVFTSKKLFLLTSNEKHKINSFMQNRPGRIYYSFEFKGLEEQFVREYCVDTLKDKSQVDRVVTVSGLFYAFNFDMLKALVEEMNRYGETPEEAMEVLNAKPEFSNYDHFDLTVFIDKVQVPEAQLSARSVRCNPLGLGFALNLGIWDGKTKDEDDDKVWDMFQVKQKDMKSFGKGTYVFVVGNKKVVLTKQEPEKFDWRDLDNHEDY